MLRKAPNWWKTGWLGKFIQTFIEYSSNPSTNWISELKGLWRLFSLPPEKKGLVQDHTQLVGQLRPWAINVNCKAEKTQQLYTADTLPSDLNFPLPALSPPLSITPLVLATLTP
jgi:hypothetical protein